MTYPAEFPGMPELGRDDPVAVEFEGGSYAGRVVTVRPDADGRWIVQVLTDPEGQLLTVYSENCSKAAA